VNPTTPDLLPSIDLPDKELFDERSMNLTTLRLQVSPIADQRPRPPPTMRIKTADRRAPLPIETAAADEDVPIKLFSSTFNCAI